jgi:glycosyltransferase involved in cell wall biosynthesis
MVKIHVFYEPLDGPWGGGNQFLKAIKSMFTSQGIHVPIEEADAILVNSHHFASSQNLQRLFRELRKNPKAALIHRMDGPVTLIRQQDDGTDSFIFKFNEFFADGTIFQSQWCYENCVKLGFQSSKPYTLIFNAPDPNLFFPAPDQKEALPRDNKIKLVATSWSPNPNKGFTTYKWMDENLDWDKYQMTFVGNSPISFTNIQHVPPLDSQSLGRILREHDIFVTASQADPCSNSLIEALHCGLPALALRDGGHPEIIAEAGLTYTNKEDIPMLLDRISKNLYDYKKNISMPNIEQISHKYIEFIEEVVQKTGHRKQWGNDALEKEYINLYKNRYERHLPLQAFTNKIKKTLSTWLSTK